MPTLDTRESQVQRVRFCSRRTKGRAGREGGIDHPTGSAIADREPGIVRRDGNPVREVQVVHHLPQDAVLRVLVHRARAVGHVWAWTGRPGIREVQIALRVEIEVAGTFEELVAPSVDQRSQFLGLGIVGEDAAVAGRQVELAVLPAGTLRLAGLADIVRRVAVDDRHQLAIGLEIRDPAAADADKPKIALVVECATLEASRLVS